MKRQAYQHPELRDANDNIIQQGAFGKNTALANSTNDGWIDYVANDLEALHDAQTAAGNAITTGGLTVTGTTSVPTANAGNSSKAIANTEYVQGELTNYLPLSGGTMTTGNTLITMGNGESYVRNWGNGLYLGGTNSDNASILALFTNSNAGGFQLQAGDGTTFKRMIGKPDGTLTWDGQPLLPVGIVQAFAGTTIPSGWLLCDGSAVSRTTYANLYAVIGTTYGAGNGSSTFNLPNLVDKFVEGGATAGTVKSAGLPNITGSIGGGSGTGGPAGQGSGVGFLRDTMINGCFQPSANAYGGETGLGGGTLPSGYPVLTANLDASRSSSVYGNSTTVQPPALTMRYIIKY